MADTSTPTIPVLALPHPFVLLTGGIINIGLTRLQADALTRLIDSSSTTPRVAAVPLVPSSSNDDDDKARLYEWGVLARITQLVRSPTRRLGPSPYIVTLTGLTRIHLPTASSSDPFSAPLLRLPYSPITSSHKISSETIRSFKSAALKLFDRLANDESQREGVRERWSALASVLEEARGERVVMLADALVGVLGVEYKDRLHLLQLEPNQMLRNLTELIEKENITASAGIHPPKLISGRRSDATTSSPGTPDEFDTSSDPDTDPDGLLELKTKIELLGVGTEERKVAVAEWKRLKRIPNASAEWAVVRGYIEWIVSVPWPASQHPSPQPQPDTKQSSSEQSTSAFLAAAREQLDADHYGLDHVKRRLVEYLAVVRLLEAQEAKVVALERERVEVEAKMKAEAEKVERDKDKDKAEKDQETVTERALVKASHSSTNDQPPPLIKAPPSTPIPLPSPPSLPPRKRLTPRGPILLFVGPPGTGKTSLGTSIASALNRPFQRIALGGVRDEGEIRGHRRTYVASSPGLIVQALRRAGRADPVILLDEVDKVGQGGGLHGDPSAALLEVLDPEQNHSFRDHYLNIPFDLSSVLFLCTANTLDTIPPALKDRCEIVRVPGYTAKEKGEIAKRFLVRRVIERCGMKEGDVILGEGVIEEVVRGYTAEAGVRGLERAVAGVVRYKAVQFSEGGEYEKEVKVEDLEGILGVPRWDGDVREREERPGVVYGLVVTGMGEGEVMPVESIAVPGKGRLKLTGSLGDVIKESGEIALSWVVAHASRLDLPIDVLNERGMDIHLHLPSGAQKKDGPSAGVAIACAFVSLLKNVPIPSDTAMTGEITLRGRVTPVGGIKEKILGAHRAGVKRVILPYANRRDVEHDVPGEIREGMKFVFVRSVEEALKVVFGEDVLDKGGDGGLKKWRGREEVGEVLSRL